MRQLLFSAALCVFASTALAESVKIDSKVFHSAYTNSSKAGSLTEYVISNETVTNWTKLFAIRQINDGKSPKKYVDNLGTEYRKKFPRMTFASGGEEAKNHWFIDFIVYAKKGEPKFVEWNFFRAETNQPKGLLIYQYVERKAFTTSVPDALRELNVTELRRQLLPVLMTNEFKILSDSHP